MIHFRRCGAGAARLDCPGFACTSAVFSIFRLDCSTNSWYLEVGARSFDGKSHSEGLHFELNVGDSLGDFLARPIHEPFICDLTHTPRTGLMRSRSPPGRIPAARPGGLRCLDGAGKAPLPRESPWAADETGYRRRHDHCLVAPWRTQMISTRSLN
jgi:hypothetical protein